VFSLMSSSFSPLDSYVILLIGSSPFICSPSVSFGSLLSGLNITETLVSRNCESVSNELSQARAGGRADTGTCSG
jgi:hypothetical protein